MSLLDLIATPAFSPNQTISGTGLLAAQASLVAATGTITDNSPSATSWIGIPDPATNWAGGLDPINTAIPAQPTEWASDLELAEHWYIDESHPNAGAYNPSLGSTPVYGCPNYPRATLPSTTTRPAGAYIELGGGTYLGAQLIWTLNGTSTNPVWIVGPGTINYQFIVKGSYIFIDGITITNQDKSIQLRTHNTSDLHHVCVRN